MARFYLTHLLIVTVWSVFLDTDFVSGAETCGSCGPCTCADVTSETPRKVVTLASGMEVVCDVATDEGGWIVFQRRASKDVDFYRGWEDYQWGFGDLTGNFWWGLEKLHQLTSKRRYELRVDLVLNGTDYYAVYDSFMILSESQNYKLKVAGYSGTAGDALDGHNGMMFSTKDADHDVHGPGNCAQVYHGAWWYHACHAANLNGLWGNTAYGQGLSWLGTHGHNVSDHYHSATFSEMKIRPVTF